MASFRGPYVVLSREEIELLRDLTYDTYHNREISDEMSEYNDLLLSIYGKCDAAIKSSPKFLEPHP